MPNTQGWYNLFMFIAVCIVAFVNHMQSTTISTLIHAIDIQQEMLRDIHETLIDRELIDDTSKDI